MLSSVVRILGHPGRRTVPGFMLVTALALGSPVFAQQHEIHVLTPQTATSSLTLIKATDPNFEGMLDTYFPGLSQEDGYQQAIKPFLVIVRNDTEFPAVAYAITWTVHYTPGWVRPLRRVFINTHLMYRPAMTYIPPGVLRLISPRFNLTPKQYQANPHFAQMNPANSFPPSNELSSVDVAVDGVMYNDGSFIGPDTTRVYEEYVAARFAERDEAIAALKLIKSSTAGSLVAQQLSQTLTQEAQRDWRAHQSTFLARYVRARGRSARDIQRILSTRGVSGLQAKLLRLVDSSARGAAPSMLDSRYRNLSDTDPRVFETFPSNSNTP